MTVKLLLSGLIFLLALQSMAQTYSPLGHHFITNASAKQYKLNPQNFGVCQDNRGIMYFANDGGVLEYDGETWRTIKVPTQRTYAIQKSTSGNIYVGALNDFGILVSDKKFGIQYRSLAKQVQNEKIPTIRKVLVSDGWVYFIPDADITANFLFAHNEKENKTYKIVTPFPMMFAGIAGNTPLIQVSNGAMYKLNKRDLILAGEAGDWKKVEVKEIFAIDNMLYAFNGKEIFMVPADFSAPVTQTQIIVPSQSHSFRTYKNLFVYAAAKGIHVCDKKGKLIYPLNKQGSLVDNNVRELFIDDNSNLWA
jgi:hypothetical protein